MSEEGRDTTSHGQAQKIPRLYGFLFIKLFNAFEVLPPLYPFLMGLARSEFGPPGCHQRRNRPFETPPELFETPHVAGTLPVNFLKQLDAADLR